jgi:L-fuconolactonase
VLAAFGPERLLFGSDWPVCLVAAEYADVVGIVRDYFSQATAGEQAQIFGDTATRFYGLTEK